MRRTERTFQRRCGQMDIRLVVRYGGEGRREWRGAENEAACLREEDISSEQGRGISGSEEYRLFLARTG